MGRRGSTGRVNDWSRSDPAAVCGQTTARSPWLREKRAFTLLEILSVLALIGLITALLLGSGDSLLRAMAKDDIETATLSAVAAARHRAVLTGQALELNYDEKSRQLTWGEDRATLADEGRMRLLPPTRISAMILGGQAVEESITRVRFYADGTCDPFRLEFIRDKTSRILVIDPWTCTVLSPGAAAGRN